ncbi:MAG: hypothetical protein ACKOZN_09475 [Cyanobium sp.]
MRALRRARLAGGGCGQHQRAVFFGPQGDTRWNQERLQEQLGDNFQLAELNPTAIVHTAAQPSPNAVGTLNLLEATRQSCPESELAHRRRLWREMVRDLWAWRLAVRDILINPLTTTAVWLFLRLHMHQIPHELKCCRIRLSMC